MGVQQIHTNKQGEKHWNAKLTDEKVIEMRRLRYEVDLCVRCIAKINKLSYSTAWEAIVGRTWIHLPMRRQL